jgi:hypothetical protein
MTAWPKDPIGMTALKLCGLVWMFASLGALLSVLGD